MGSAFAARLLCFAIASEASFFATRVGKDEGKPGERIRRSVKLAVSEDYDAFIEQAVGNSLPHILHDLGIRPFPVVSYEIELVGHGDGGFDHRHIDTFTGSGGSRSGDRVVSCVYYFHSRQSSFPAVSCAFTRYRHVSRERLNRLPLCQSTTRWLRFPHGCRMKLCLRSARRSNLKIIDFQLIAGSITKANLSLRRTCSS